MLFEFPLIEAFFISCMRGLMPLRKLGAYGTPDDPLYFSEGDTVPWWIECRYPLNIGLTFAADVETYYEDGCQYVRPVESAVAALNLVANGRACLLVGAPTFFDHRPRRRKPIGKLRLAYSSAT